VISYAKRVTPAPYSEIGNIIAVNMLVIAAYGPRWIKVVGLQPTPDQEGINSNSLLPLC